MISRAKSPLLQAIVECISTGHHAPWESSELFLFAYVCGAHPVKRFVPRGHPVLHFCFRYGYYCNGQCNRLAAFHHHPLVSGFVTLQLLLVAGKLNLSSKLLLGSWGSNLCLKYVGWNWNVHPLIILLVGHKAWSWVNGGFPAHLIVYNLRTTSLTPFVGHFYLARRDSTSTRIRRVSTCPIIDTP